MVGPSGKVLAFEPNPNNLRNLRRHIAVNSIRNVEIIDAAVSSTEGHAYFGGGDYRGRLGETAGTRVRTVKLDDFGIPELIKMDIEGAELDALAGAKNILAARKTVWFIATHGEQLLIDCKKKLVNSGYAIFHQQRSDEFCAIPLSPSEERQWSVA
jgi:FkbM family methyltransferase